MSRIGIMGSLRVSDFVVMGLPWILNARSQRRMRDCRARGWLYGSFMDCTANGGAANEGGSDSRYRKPEPGAPGLPEYQVCGWATRLKDSREKLMRKRARVAFANAPVCESMAVAYEA